MAPATAHPALAMVVAAFTTPPRAAFHCHRPAWKNAEVTAPAKKSRDTVCHEKSSPNYSTLKQLVSHPSLQACLTSGGRAFGR
jgi:hypothetical protein